MFFNFLIVFKKMEKNIHASTIYVLRTSPCKLRFISSPGQSFNQLEQSVQCYYRLFMEKQYEKSMIPF